jgi:hypothetical protein
MSMTEFGFLLSELMERRGMDAAALATALAGWGYEQANEYSLVAYMQGELEVDPRLPSFLAGALTLSFEEKRFLALAFTYGQDQVQDHVRAPGDSLLGSGADVNETLT